jgi:hypothetical protein
LKSFVKVLSDPSTVKILQNILEKSSSEVEGEINVEVPPIESEVISMLIKVKKVNIGIVEQPKMDGIGDYWDEKTIERITELLHEYNDLFPTTFTEIKGIAKKLGEMKIPLRSYARPIKQ